MLLRHWLLLVSLLLIGVGWTGCGNAVDLNWISTDKISLVQQGPWELRAQGLTEEQLQGQDATAKPSNPAGLVVAAVKLRLQGQDAHQSVAELLQQQAPTYSPQQVQHALFYQMAEAGSLEVGNAHFPAKAAYVEMTTQRDYCTELVFVFALPRQRLAQESTVQFQLTNAFFLSQPAAFTLPVTQLLAI